MKHLETELWSLSLSFWSAVLAFALVRSATRCRGYKA